MKKTEHINGHGSPEKVSGVTSKPAEKSEESNQPVRKRSRRRRLPAW